MTFVHIILMTFSTIVIVFTIVICYSTFVIVVKYDYCPALVHIHRKFLIYLYVVRQSHHVIVYWLNSQK